MKKIIFAIFSVVIFNSCVPLLLVGAGAAAGAVTYDCISKDGTCHRLIENRR